MADGYEDTPMQAPDAKELSLFCEQLACLAGETLQALRMLSEAVERTEADIGHCATGVFVSRDEMRRAREIAYFTVLKIEQAQKSLAEIAARTGEIAFSLQGVALKTQDANATDAHRTADRLMKRQIEICTTEAGFLETFARMADMEHDCKAIRPREMQRVCGTFLTAFEQQIKEMGGEAE